MSNWCFDMEMAKSIDRDFAILKSGKVYSPCKYERAGIISEDECWLVWNKGAPDYFSEVIQPEAWCIIKLPIDIQE